MERKLTAILSADVEGYSRLMGEDEEATIRTLTFYRQQMELHPTVLWQIGVFHPERSLDYHGTFHSTHHTAKLV